MAELSGSARKTIEGPNIALLLMKDGSHVSPVWISHENGYLALNTVVGHLKGRNMRRDLRVAISLADRDDHTDHADVRGRVVELVEGEEADRQLDEQAKKYEGVGEHPWRREGERRVKVLVEPLAVPT
ncbi:MAG TPA: hypothetical protein VK915_01285 [Gaiellaceae bacterium]|nr:hypothetical protein [Gaiellaceae bacterium]